MLKIGDRVKFLNDIGGGKVISFQSKTIAIVENEDGFDIPVMITELVKVEDVSQDNIKINRDFSANSSKQEVEIIAEPEHVHELIDGNDDPNFFMAFNPVNQENPVGGEIEIYLINDSNFTLLYHYAHYDGDRYTTIDAGELEPNTKNYIEGLSQTDLSDLPKFLIRIIPYMKDAKKLLDPIVKEIAVNSVKFYKEKSFTPNDFFDGNAMVFDIVTKPLKEEIDKLTEKDFKKIIEEKDKINRPIQTPKVLVKTPEIVEVDLHIDELIDSTNGLSNREILDVQIDRFQSEMKVALENKVKRIVFIHGVGNGVLKEEIAKKLKSTYARFNYQDASFKEYGYGATMVILRRK